MSTTARLIKVKHFALSAHGAQKYGDLPYEVHLEKCLEVSHRLVTDAMLQEAGVSREQLQTAVWLHDVVEDCSGYDKKGVRRDDWMVSLIASQFGTLISNMVWAVSDAPGETRKAKKWGTIQRPGPMHKLRDRTDAILVKLIDRIANVEASLASSEKLPQHRQNKKMLATYREEQADLRKLRKSGAVETLWDHLEELLVPAAGSETFEG